MSVTVFSATNCAVCHAEMQWLTKQGVAYDEVVVDENDDNMGRLMEATGGVFQTTPFTVIEIDGKKETISGFDRGKLQSLLGIS
jgi:glutaredoxin